MSATASDNWTFGMGGSDDVAQIADLVNAAYRGEGGSVGWTSEADMVRGPRITMDILRKDLAESPHAAVLVLRDSAHLLACVRVERSRSAGGEAGCYIGMFAVCPGVQNRGVGRALLEHAENHGRQWGAQVARMTVVSVRASLIAWYERRGYRRTGETENFPYDDARFGTPLRADLEFVILAKSLRAAAPELKSAPQALPLQHPG